MGGAGRALACGDLIAEANPTFLSAESDFLMGLGELVFLAGGGTAGGGTCGDTGGRCVSLLESLAGSAPSILRTPPDLTRS